MVRIEEANTGRTKSLEELKAEGREAWPNKVFETLGKALIWAYRKADPFYEQMLNFRRSRYACVHYLLLRCSIHLAAAPS